MTAATLRSNFEPIGPYHAPLFHGLNADPQEMRYFPDPPSADETDAFIGLLRAEFDAPFTPAVEVGWRLAPEFWGAGAGTRRRARRWYVGSEKRGLAK